MTKISNILIVGATSAIAYEVAKIYSLKGCKLTLLARNEEKLEAIKADLLARGAGEVSSFSGDLSDNNNIENLFSRAIQNTTGFDLIFLAYGILGSQDEAQNNSEQLVQILNTNFVSAAIWCEKAAAYLQKQNKGALAVIGSVAGDRGRKSNYIYGSSKAAIDTYLAGMRHRFANSSIKIITIKPGFVDTPMTDGFNKSGILWASPKKVAQDIVAKIELDREILYTPWFWRYIMLVIKLLPAPIFNRLNL